MTDWYEVYNRLALLMSQFYSIHKDISGSKLFELLSADKEFFESNVWIEKILDKEYDDVRSVDPIQIFASLNESKARADLRIKRINILFRLLGDTFYSDQINFTGCPSPFSIKIMGVRSQEVQKQIWKVFFDIVDKGENGLTAKTFTQLNNWYGIDLGAFTIFLFWVNSNLFLPLDKNTITFLIGNRKLQEYPSNYNDYHNLLINTPRNIYRELVAQAYNFISLGNNEFEMSPELFSYIQGEGSPTYITTDFRILAIRPLQNMSSKYLKVLRIDTMYQFYNSYDFSNPEQVTYNSQKDVKLYNIAQEKSTLNVNLSAIVGRNGSGKSSLLDLLFIGINNLSKKVVNTNDVVRLDKCHFELYYYTDTIYKLLIHDKEVFLYKYEKQDNTYQNPQPVTVNKKFLNTFFYTIAINYSHYALNSRELGKWIDPLFHKNDAYQIPIAINPMRNEGNIDINKENYLVTSRLLANLLDPDAEFREIAEDGKLAKSLKLKLDVSKVALLYGKIEFPSENYQKQIIDLVYEYFNININNRNEIIVCADKYIFKKLVKISLIYNKYKDYYDKESGTFKAEKFELYLKKLDGDHSHLTNKLKQAINFLRFPHLKHHNVNESIEIHNLSIAIQNVISENYPVLKLRTIELIPPPFFSVEIELNNNSNFDKLSSGEKQRIHTISSLIYHLININSVERIKTDIKYSFVNVLFDEVELYFHPEMQRTFVDHLIKRLKKVELNYIAGVNFCFVTHSPLILSDIPDANILFLKANGIPEIESEKIKTFGGNIHDLLAESFFLENGFIGDFARRKIEEVIQQLNSKDNFINKENEFAKMISIIGEPFIREQLWKMYYAKYKKEDERQKRIKELEAQILTLKNA